ncbi:hypothetical protein [Flavobacterium sp. GT3R68]|uniref:hypothetical protein n=1 Tax=Flavobacterium sp. GT3R68 TaxID=2594437 RepID=UPI000F872E63|nr:hypothetical protein [Flavobacterium sp. GT3R68]RTY94006.1 hypothetical protein EKL32_14090 [Flavobacterium sp. GSN2]TRW93382.1 hypothetical protein FNW07_00295 [Flavobacterium sp. GT3R68]
MDHTKKYKQINPNAEFDFTVNDIETKNGFILNNEYYYGGGVYLQKNNNSSKWLSQEISLDDGTALFNEDGQILLDIWKIKTPYEIYKKANSNILYLVKNKDTLQFRIQ